MDPEGINAHTICGNTLDLPDLVRRVGIFKNRMLVEVHYMRQKALALIFLAIAGSVRAQGDIPAVAHELQPVQNAFTYHTPEYHARLRRILFGRAAWRNEFQFLMLPSFEPETLLTLREEKGEYRAHVLRPNIQIWGFRSGEAPFSLEEREKVLPKHLAERGVELWRTMLLRTRYQRYDPMLDGVSYFFIKREPGSGPLLAESRNPAGGTKPGFIAGIGELLIKYVEAPPKKEQKIQQRIEELMDRLESAIRGVIHGWKNTSAN